MILHEDKKKFHSAIHMAAAALNIKPHFVEKDYWICRSLQQMVRSDASHHAIFKGGTSLTKAYNIGARFSEDIDVAIADAHLMSGNQLKTTIRRTAHSMTEGLVEVVKPNYTSKGSHYHKAYYAYPTISDVPTTSAVRSGELLLEINSFANPYPWEMRTIRCFITEFMLMSGNDVFVEQFDMADIEVPVLDCRRTLTEKLVSLMRCSLADDYLPQMTAKIRHFYDLYYLLHDEACQAYIHSYDFHADFQSLLEHDRQSFSKPDGWQTRPLNQSPLIVDLHATWQLLQPTYINELPDLAYRDIPSVDAVEDSIATLLSLIISNS
jgi:predicted nucleotidyltransferase component of viral defense system